MKNIWIQSLAITGFVFFLLWGANGITDLKLFNAFDPISQALSGFELTDIAFSNIRVPPKVDQRIVMVNFATLPRRDVAQMIMTISAAKPKVIGIDGFYNCEGGLRTAKDCPQLLDTLGNLMLAAAIEGAGNVVLVNKLLQSDSVSKMLGNDFIVKTLDNLDIYDSIEYSDPIFSSNAKNAYANLLTDPPATYQEDPKTCRSFIPSFNVRGKTEYAFAVQIAMLYDSVQTKKFLARRKNEEVVNYRGNFEFQDIKLKNVRKESTSDTKYPMLFYGVGPADFEEGVSPELFKDRIVIIGFMGDYLGDPTHSDKYFTPLNKKVAGRANPDMFGVVVHANIVAMILTGDYVDELAEWQKLAVAIIVCFLTVALFIRIDEAWPVWYDALQAIIQIVQLILISFLVVQVFSTFSYKLDLSITLGVAALVGPSYDIFQKSPERAKKAVYQTPNSGIKEYLKSGTIFPNLDFKFFRKP